jgi:RNA polymerase sigma factor (sigma-70 family)
LTDEKLVAAVCGGDDEAFARLFGRYHERITAYVGRMVGDRDHAQELAQEAFVSALHRLRESGEGIAFKPWIYRIAHNAAIDHLRSVTRRGVHIEFDNVEAAGVASERYASTMHGPEAAVETRQSIENLQGAFGGLSSTHHELLVLRELEGLSYDEIGERLGMSRSQVESTLFRARRRLEAEYEELASGARCEAVRDILERGSAASGIREERRVAQHLAHCRSCRRDAHQALVAA